MEFRDLKRQYEHLKPEIDSAIQSICANANFIAGTEIKELENSLASYTGVKHCITCANGTDALTLVLMAWGIGAGDAVFVPDFTFFATAETPAFEGATPIFVDVDKSTFNIDVIKLENTIKEILKEGKLKPKVIIPVDLFGMPANYDEIERIAEKYDLLVLEDGAQGFGGKLNDKMACSFGDAATTSFFPAKPLGCYGDGGAIFTNDDKLANVIRSLSVHGKDGADKYNNIRVGLNSRLDTIQAAVLNVKFNAFVTYENEQTNIAADYYTKELMEFINCPIIPQGYYSSRAQYTITLNDKNQRDNLQKFLKDNSIPSMVYYPRTMSQQGALNRYIKCQPFECEVAKQLTSTCLSLPIGPYITKCEQDRVISYVKLFLKQ